jgi:acetoin utilization protein AcuC
MMLSNVALWETINKLTRFGLPTVILGGGGYNPWTVCRYWAGIWATISGLDIPGQLPEKATEMLRRMKCDLIDEDDVDETWLTTMADSSYPGPVRDAVKSLASLAVS